MATVRPLALVLINVFRRCTAPPDDLDSGQHPRRSHELTAAYIDTGLSVRKLWDEHGIVGYLTVSTKPFSDI